MFVYDEKSLSLDDPNTLMLITVFFPVPIAINMSRNCILPLTLASAKNISNTRCNVWRVDEFCKTRVS